MKSEVRRGILRTLKLSIKYLEEESIFRLRELSDHTIHNASIFQDEDSISVAVIIYALSKMIQRDRKVPKTFIDLLREAKEVLTGKDMKEYINIIRKITLRIEKMDSQMKLYIQKVINNSEIKKGSRIYENGISLSRAAEMLGVSQWEMMAYVGKTSIIDKSPVYSTDVHKKINHTRNIFSSKSHKILVFDSGPIISMTMNHLMWILDPLKQMLNGEFVISSSVKNELIDKPLATKKFKFEALHTNRYINKKTLTVYPEEEYKELSDEIMELCNSAFYAAGNPIKVVHGGEVETIAIALKTGSKDIVVDERTTRLIIESPHTLEKILSSKLRQNIRADVVKLKDIKKRLSGLNVIRSVELVTFAYEKGLLDRYLPDRPYQRVTLLDAVLWGLKLNGCAVSENEILDIIAIENKGRL